MKMRSPHILAHKLLLSQSIFFFKINKKQQHMFYHLSVYCSIPSSCWMFLFSLETSHCYWAVRPSLSDSPSLLVSHSRDHFCAISPLMYICESEWLSGDEVPGTCLCRSWREERTETIIYFLLLGGAIFFFHYIIQK